MENQNQTLTNKIQEKFPDSDISVIQKFSNFLSKSKGNYEYYTPYLTQQKDSLQNLKEINRNINEIRKNLIDKQDTKIKELTKTKELINTEKEKKSEIKENKISILDTIKNALSFLLPSFLPKFLDKALNTIFGSTILNFLKFSGAGLIKSLKIIPKFAFRTLGIAFAGLITLTKLSPKLWTLLGSFVKILPNFLKVLAPKLLGLTSPVGWALTLIPILYEPIKNIVSKLVMKYLNYADKEKQFDNSVTSNIQGTLQKTEQGVLKFIDNQLDTNYADRKSEKDKLNQINSVNRKINVFKNYYKENSEIENIRKKAEKTRFKDFESAFNFYSSFFNMSKNTNSTFFKLLKDYLLANDWKRVNGYPYDNIADFKNKKINDDFLIKTYLNYIYSLNSFKDHSGISLVDELGDSEFFNKQVQKSENYVKSESNEFIKSQLQNTLNEVENKSFDKVGISKTSLINSTQLVPTFENVGIEKLKPEYLGDYISKNYTTGDFKKSNQNNPNVSGGMCATAVKKGLEKIGIPYVRGDAKDFIDGYNGLSLIKKVDVSNALEISKKVPSGTIAISDYKPFGHMQVKTSKGKWVSDFNQNQFINKSNQKDTNVSFFTTEKNKAQNIKKIIEKDLIIKPVTRDENKTNNQRINSNMYDFRDNQTPNIRNSAIPIFTEDSNIGFGNSTFNYFEFR